MLVRKIYVRPVDDEAHDRALAELNLYVETRNHLTDIANKWLRIGDQPIVPEYVAIANQHRANPPEVGRRPTLRTTVRCRGRRITVRDDDPKLSDKLERAAAATKDIHITQSEGIEGALEKLRQKWGEVQILETVGQRYRVRCTKPVSKRSPPLKEEWIKASPGYEAKLKALREQWEHVRIIAENQGRSDHAELRAADQRAAYRRHVDAGGYYGTFHLATEAVAAAQKTTEYKDALGRLQIRRLRITETSDEGRAAIDLGRLVWDEDNPLCVHIHGTTWTCERRQITQRPLTQTQEEFAHAMGAKLDPRRPPTGAKIVRAHLQRDRMSATSRPNVQYNWYLVLTLDVDVAMREPPMEPAKAALDLCWRQTEDGLSLRIAYLADADGPHQEITVPTKVMAALDYYANLQSLADREADRLRELLKMPERSGHRILVQRAYEQNGGPPKTNYRDRPADTWTAAEIAHHMIHLDECAHHGRRNALVQRDACYMREIRGILETYSVIHIENMQADPALKTKAGGAVARDQRHRAAPFTFFTLLKREAARYGTRIELCSPAYTSRLCTCGYDMGPSSQLYRTCSECGIRWDVDHLAAINLLGRSSEPPPTPKAPAGDLTKGIEPP